MISFIVYQYDGRTGSILYHITRTYKTFQSIAFYHVFFVGYIYVNISIRVFTI